MADTDKYDAIQNMGEEDPTIRKKKEVFRQRDNIKRLRDMYTKIVTESKFKPLFSHFWALLTLFSQGPFHRA